MRIYFRHTLKITQKCFFLHIMIIHDEKLFKKIQFQFLSTIYGDYRMPLVGWFFEIFKIPHFAALLLLSLLKSYSNGLYIK